MPESTLTVVISSLAVALTLITGLLYFERRLAKVESKLSILLVRCLGGKRACDDPDDE